MYLSRSHDEMELLRDTRWVDGIRGIASLFVVASHIVLCVAREITNPCCGPNERTPSLFQLPFLRLISSGHSWVATFFLLSGFVNSLKPLRAMRSGRPDAALLNLATSSFRRSFRLMLPAAVATIINWFLCNMGLYEVASQGDAFWLYTYNPKPSASWGVAIVDLLAGIRNTWSLDSMNPYDQPQWLLKWLLMGSMMVFITLLITVHMSPMWRSIIVFSLSLWSFQWTYHQWDPSLGQAILPGILLAELSLSPILPRLSSYSWLLTPILMLLGTYMMSFPTGSHHAITWSSPMLYLNDFLPETHEPARVWGTIGSITAVTAILISVTLRRILSSRLCVWLGSISYPIYLLHSIFLRTVFAWIVFACEDKVLFPDKDTEGRDFMVERFPLPGRPRIVLGIVVSMGLMLVACECWQRFVEPLFGKITKCAEECMAAEPSSPLGKLELGMECP